MTDIDESTFCKQMLTTPLKEIAQEYVAPLLSEDILKVTKDHVTIMSLVIPRDRVVYFHIALTVLRRGEAITQSERGFTVSPVHVADGNEVIAGYKIVSNAEDKGEIFLTRKLAAELWEVLAFFLPEPIAQTTTDKVE
jgi:hypothetical protein